VLATSDLKRIFTCTSYSTPDIDDIHAVIRIGTSPAKVIDRK